VHRFVILVLITRTPANALKVAWSLRRHATVPRTAAAGQGSGL